MEACCAQVGQSKQVQLDTLKPLLEKLGAAGERVYVKNGYTFAESGAALKEVGATIAGAQDYDGLIGGLSPFGCYQGSLS